MLASLEPSTQISPPIPASPQDAGFDVTINERADLLVTVVLGKLEVHMRFSDRPKSIQDKDTAGSVYRFRRQNLFCKEN